MREKALRNESLDQNNAKDCLQSCGYSGKWTSFLPFRVQLQDVRHRAQKWNVGPERRKGLGTSRADVSGNARHFCDGELDFTRMWARARLGRKTEAKTTKPTRNAGRFFIRKSNKFSPLKWKIYFAVQNCLWYIISIIQPILKENNHDWKTQY